jgi:hypothetical protein
VDVVRMMAESTIVESKGIGYEEIFDIQTLYPL